VGSSLSAELVREQCLVCLQMFPIGGLARVRDENDGLVGCICPNCLNLGKRNTMMRLRKRVNSLQRSSTNFHVFIPLKEMTEAEWANYLLTGLKSVKRWPSRNTRLELKQRLKSLRALETLSK